MNQKKIFVRKNKRDDAAAQEKSSQKNTSPLSGSSDDINDEETNIPAKQKLSPGKITYAQLCTLLLSMMQNNQFQLDSVLKFARIMFEEGLRAPEIMKQLQHIQSKGKSIVSVPSTKEKLSRSR